ncbi:AbrB family transcriptional regulator [Rhodospirillum centenum]|uniref:Ammonia monooxygenase, putative n=1 Tax=Rhodospirillum centenum (strain ATCC 51521 / SW) TaxID=414684 RepID=B6ITE5_RHOCS|nr:AbrB family transcriptional regulator [Rhodospirillum centenum]ACI99163.1 ammonia monooxygenase, putative [Rhodospirillum centenum SW]
MTAAEETERQAPEAAGVPAGTDWRGLAATLGLGAAGGSLFFLLHVPLAFMIGALVSVTAAAMAGVRVSVPRRLRTAMVVVLGIMLGSAFRPAMLEHLSEWAVSLGGLVLYTVAAALAGLLYLRRVARYDGVTAYFTAMPGGFQEMVLMGAAMGGDDRTIALAHSMRIMLTVLTVPFAFQLLPGFAPAARDWSLGGLGPGLIDLPLRDVALLAACALGAPVAQRLRIPAGMLVGPMLLSAAVHLSGLTVGKPPGLLVAAAQVVVGAGIGCRFVGVPLRTIVAVAAAALGLTVALLAVTVLMALSVHLLTGLDLAALILAYAPGGLAEMSLVALSLHVDAAFVATHHIARIVLIVIFAPLAWRLWQAHRRRGAGTPPGVR